MGGELQISSLLHPVSFTDTLPSLIPEIVEAKIRVVLTLGRIPVSTIEKPIYVCLRYYMLSST